MGDWLSDDMKMSRVPHGGVVKAFDRNLFVPVNSEQEGRKKVTLKLSQSTNRRKREFPTERKGH